MATVELSSRDIGAERRQILRSLCEAAGRLAIGVDRLTLGDYLRLRQRDHQAHLPPVSVISITFGSFERAIRAASGSGRFRPHSD